MVQALDRRFYLGADGDLSVLANTTVAVVGYGNLGRSVAHNLRDSGLTVVVGNREDAFAEQAREEGFQTISVSDAISEAEVVWMLLPDEVIPSVLPPAGGPRVRDGGTLCLSSGYVLAFDLVDPAAHGGDVVMVAPRMVGAEVRRRYVQDEGFVAYLSVEHDQSGRAADRVLALARGIGGASLRAMVLSARDEAIVDLFVEQTFGPYVGMALLSTFEAGIAAGLPPEALVLELYLSGEMSRTWQAFAEEGFFRGVRLHGRAAAFGGFVRTSGLDTQAMRSAFGEILEDIRNGGFAKRFQQEAMEGYPTFELIDAMIAGDDPLSAAEARIRRAFDRSSPD